VKAAIERLERPAYRCAKTSIGLKSVNRSHESSVAIVDSQAERVVGSFPDDI